MAEPKTSETKDQDRGQAPEPSKGMVGKIVPWLVPVLTIVICASAGFVVGRLFGARGSTQTVSAAETPLQQSPKRTADDGPSWFYDLEPVLGNLNEPGVVRYVRLGLTLEVTGISEREGAAFFQQRKPLLKNWLTLYLNNLTLDDVRGERNLRQMQTQITDAFNQTLFAGAGLNVKRVLFKELSIQ